MIREELLEMLKEKHIFYEITEHIPVFTIEEMLKIKLPYPEIIAKNLFIRDDKKLNYYLISVQEERSINLKEFQKQFGTRKLSFASESDLIRIMGLIKGSVTPFGLLNDEEKKVQLFVGKEFIGKKLGIHPLDNMATMWINASDLVELLKEHGNSVFYF